MGSNGTGIVLVPCSGIGKVHGLIGREAVYEAIEEVGEEAARTLCLALLVMGDEEARRLVRDRPCITVDGCPKLCAYKNLELAGGRIVHGARVVDVVKRHRGAQPGTATGLTQEGWAIVGEMAHELAAKVQECLAQAKEVKRG